jgi:hypothetical protein
VFCNEKQPRFYLITVMGSATLARTVHKCLLCARLCESRRDDGLGRVCSICSMQVCHKCAVWFDTLRANMGFSTTFQKRFRAGLVGGKWLISHGESIGESPADSTTLNQ